MMEKNHNNLKKILAIYIVLFLVSSACMNGIENPHLQTVTKITPFTPSETFPISTKIRSVGQTLLPSKTLTKRPINTDTPIPATNTPYQSISSNGSYLAYLNETSENNYKLVFLDADPIGRKVITLPSGIDVGNLKKSLSPNGEWLAFYTGSAGMEICCNEPPQFDMSGPFELTLNIMHIPDQKIITISKLLSTDYPNNFNQIAQSVIKNDPFFAGVTDIEIAKEFIEQLFFMGIKDSEWSHNSRYLAFSAEIDGPSSDLYVYDTTSQTIQRLTDGLGEMTGGIEWSPNDKWIFHTSSNSPFVEQWAYNIFVARSDGGEVKDLGFTMDYGGWISSDTIILSEAANGEGRYELRTVNVESKKVTILWAESFGDYTVLDDGDVVLCAMATIKDYPKSGLYLLHPDGQSEYLSSDFGDCEGIYYRGPFTHLLVLFSPGKGIIGITKKGDSTIIQSEYKDLFVSPDYTWMVLSSYADENQICPLNLYDKNDVFVRQLISAQVDTMTWRPDSLGVYFNTDRNLYYISIPNGNPILIDDNLVLYTNELGNTQYLYKWIR
jgi:Tol biopolymer transport system component